ncbi:efflux RND transporter periplasmic adaptor subunit [uncultured Aquimonas sp.]|uniref:efflux RND transporter periplasmic adaptor subunit n=1 Tax=uncultured Aquimonas sp. TaxID=385483 RepID=UPI0031BAF373
MFALLLAACGTDTPHGAAEGGHAAPTAGEFERGPHNGRLLREGDFALEITIFEDGVPPQYRLYAYQGGKPLDPAAVQAKIELTRLDGEINVFEFSAEQDHLGSPDTVTEPHSFDVKVSATYGGRDFNWSFASYEGRTTIPAAAAREAGVVVEAAGPATIRDVVPLLGTVAMDDNRHASVRARFPGIVRSVSAQLGQTVSPGQALATIEANESMRSYPVTAPIGGVVLARNTNVGDVAGDAALFEIADLSRVWVELRAIGSDADRLAPGQAVRVRSATGDTMAQARIDTILPIATSGQGVIARVVVPNEDGRWRPGMTVSAEVTVSAREVPLAVKESGLQPFRDFTVVFAQVEDTYEVRMLELGERDGDYAEVLGGLKPGTPYVSGNSFLIRSDIEKSGASHDH